MYSINIWGRNTPTEETEESISVILWGHVVEWLKGKEWTVFDGCDDEDVPLHILSDFDENMVRSIWRHVLSEVESTIAATVRGVVPDVVVRRWLDRRLVTRRPIDGHKERACEQSDAPATAARAADIDSAAAARQVLEGLRLLTRAAADPDLAESLAVTEHAPLAVWLTPALPQIDSRRATATAVKG